MRAGSKSPRISEAVDLRGRHPTLNPCGQERLDRISAPPFDQARGVQKFRLEAPTVVTWYYE